MPPNKVNESFLSPQFMLTCSLLFFLPAANNYPGRIYYYLFGLQGYSDLSLIHLFMLPSIILSLLIIITKLIQYDKDPFIFTPFTLSFLFVSSLLFLAGSISTLANYSMPGILTNYISGYISPLLIGIAFNQLKMTLHRFRVIFLAFVLGCAFPLVLGLYTYLHTHSLTNASSLIMAHFDLQKMSPYMIQTFGNVDNTSVFMGMIATLFFSLILHENLSRKTRLVFFIFFIFAIVHLVILEVRTSLICFSFLTLIISFIKNKKVFFIYISILTSLFILFYILSPKSFHLFFGRLYLALTWSNQGYDVSSGERLEAMKLGLKLFINNWLLGIGSGQAHQYFSYGSAHQFNIQQGMELGILGFLTSILLAYLIIHRFFKLLWNHRHLQHFYEKLIFMVCPVYYSFFSLCANAPLITGVVNTWICLVFAFTFLSDCEFIQS